MERVPHRVHWRNARRPSILPFGIRVAPCTEPCISEAAIDRERNRVEIQRAAKCRLRFVRTSRTSEEQCVQMQRMRVGWIQGDRAAELFFCVCEVAVITL